MRVQLLIGLLVAGVCSYFAFRGMSFAELGQALRQADPRWIVVAMGVYFTGYLLRAWRWHYLLRPIKNIPSRQLFGPMVLGFFANNILPFRMGELIRAHLTGRKFAISRTASLGTILLERLCDTISFLSTFVLSACFFPFPRSAERGAAIMGVLCVGLILCLFIGIRFQSRLHAWIDLSPLPPRWKTRVQDLTENFVQGVSGMRDMRCISAAVALSMVVWTIEGTTLYLIAQAFPISFHYPEAFFLLFFMGLSVTLPQAPGYVGTMELFGVTALALLGIPKEQGLPVILTIHGCQFLMISFFGVIMMGREGLTLRGLIKNE